MGDALEPEDFGTAMRRIRLSAGLSLRQLSAIAKLDHTYLSKIENHRRPPTPTVAKAVDTALDAAGFLVALGAGERVRRDEAAVASSDMRRRTFFTGAMATAFGSAVSVPTPGRVGEADVDRLQRAVVRIRALGHQHGGEGLWQAAENIAKDGYKLLEYGTYSEVTGQQLVSAIGRAQMCAGWLAFDSGQQDTARSCYNEALSLARQTDNASIEVHALANLAFQSSFLGMPRQALRFADAAGRIASAYNPVSKMTVVPYLRQATAHAIAGDRQYVRGALDDARRRLDRAYDEQPDDWCSFVSAAELDGIEATTAMMLGDFSRAETLLLRSIEAHGNGFARNRALYRVRLATTRLGRGDITGAADAANEALTDLGADVASWVVQCELGTVARALSSHRSLAPAQAFTDRYATLADR